MSDAGSGAGPSEVKAALLRQWRAGNQPVAVAAPERHVPRHGDGPAPLSFAQQRLWFLEQLTPGTTVHNLSHCVSLDGTLDPDILAAALDDVVEHQDVLRTVVQVNEGTPWQVFAESARPVLDVVDLRSSNPDRAFAEATALARSTVDTPMDMATGPLARLVLYRLPERDMMLVVVHHLIGDGWALSVALHELSECYRSRAARQEPALHPLPLRVVDLAADERSAARGREREAFGKEIGFWTERLAGLRPLRLPADHTPPATLGSAGDWVPVALEPDLERDVRELARAHDATAYMVLLAAYTVLLHGMTGETDVAVAGAVSGRDDRRTHGLVGNLTNTVVLRSTADPREPFVALLGAVRRTCLDAVAHQRVPFDKLVEALRLSGRAASSGPVPVSFVMQPPSSLTTFAGLAMEQVELGWTTARADLELMLRESPAISGGLVFRTDLFRRDHAELLAERLVTILRAVVAAPDTPLDRLDLLTQAESALINAAAIGAERTVSPTSVPELVARRGENSPDATAVSWPGGRLTRAELDHDAGRLAHRLTELGVAPGDPVAVCLPRSAELVVAALGVLKAAAVYLPLDPAHAPARLERVLADSGAVMLIGERSLVADLACEDVATIAVGPGREWLGAAEAPAPARRCDPDAVAYLVYTSGSTGEPKGVEVTHRSVVNYLGSLSEEHGIGPADVIGAVASPAFDASVAELLGGIAIAGGVHLIPPGDAGDAPRLATALRDGGCTVLSATPTMWRMLAADPDGLARLSLTALAGGETVSERLAGELAAGQSSAWTQYGPTETTVWVTVGRLAEREPVSLGRPIRNTRVHILDERLRRVPVGAVGEICVGGVAVARGYRGRPRQTAAAFVPDPFGSPGSRLYRTGDYARLRADGTMQFIGRRDNQVKVRGHRVELGEIEAVLGAHSAVTECVVTAFPWRQEDDSVGLVAYVCGGNAALYQDGELIPALRRMMRERVPGYMVPDKFILMDSLPRTGTGKVDRTALPEPGRAGRDLGTQFVEPRTELERQVAVMVAEFLDLDRVGAHDDFFDLGGNSVGAAQLVLRLRERFGVELVLQKLIGGLTVEELARTIQQEMDRRTQLSDPAERIQQLVGELTDDKVDALLATLLAQRGR